MTELEYLHREFVIPKEVRGQRNDHPWWLKAKGDRIEGGRWEWVGHRTKVAGKWRQLYLNSNKKKRKKSEWRMLQCREGPD